MRLGGGGRNRGRIWEIREKENTKFFFYSFSEPPKNAMPYFLLHPLQKGKALF